jgi:hypothetical protein
MRRGSFPVLATPRLQLAHPRREDSADRFQFLHPITVARPGTGTRDAAVDCATCGERVALRLSSAAWVLSERRRQKRIGVTILGLMLGSAAPLVFLGFWMGGWWEVLSMLGFLLIILVPVSVVGFLGRAAREDGVSTVDAVHSLREPGENVYEDGSSLGIV